MVLDLISLPAFRVMVGVLDAFLLLLMGSSGKERNLHKFSKLRLNQKKLPCC